VAAPRGHRGEVMKPQRRASAARSAHVIETLEWQCRFGDRGAAWRHHQRLSDFLQSAGGQVIEALFSELSGPDEVWAIDHLELDLGALRPEGSAEEWAAQLRTQLRAVLLRMRGDGAIERGAALAKPAAEQDLDDFLHYIRHGHLPWAHGALPGRDLASWLARLARRDGVGLWRRLRASGASTQTLARLTQITPHHGLQALLASRNSELAASLELLDAELLAPLRRRGRIGDYAARQLQQEWRGAAVAALWDHDGGRLGADRIARLLRALQASVEARIGAGWRNALPAATVTPKGELARALWQGLVAPDGPTVTTVAVSGDQAVAPTRSTTAASPVAQAALAQVLSALDGARPLAATRLVEMLEALRLWQPGWLRQQLGHLALRQSVRTRWAMTLPTPVFEQLLQALSGEVSQPSSAFTELTSDPSWRESLRQFALARLSLAADEVRLLGVSRLQGLLAAQLLRHLAEGGAMPRSYRAWQALWWRSWRNVMEGIAPSPINPGFTGVSAHWSPAPAAMTSETSGSAPASRSRTRPHRDSFGSHPEAVIEWGADREDPDVAVHSTPSPPVQATPAQRVVDASVVAGARRILDDRAAHDSVVGADRELLGLAPRAFITALSLASAAPAPRRALLAAYVRGQQQASRISQTLSPVVLQRQWRQALLMQVRRMPTTLSVSDLIAQRARWREEAGSARAPQIELARVGGSEAHDLIALVDEWLTGAVVYDANDRWRRAQRLQRPGLRLALQSRLQRRGLRQEIARDWHPNRKLELLHLLSAPSEPSKGAESGLATGDDSWRWLPALIQSWAARQAAVAPGARIGESKSVEVWLWRLTIEAVIRDPGLTATPDAVQLKWQAAYSELIGRGVVGSGHLPPALRSRTANAPPPVDAGGRASALAIVDDDGDRPMLALPATAFITALIAAASAPVPARTVLAAYVRAQRQASRMSPVFPPSLLRQRWRRELLTLVRQAPATLSANDLVARRRQWQHEARGEGAVQLAPTPTAYVGELDLPALVDDWLQAPLFYDANARWSGALQRQTQKLRAELLRRLRHHGLRREIASRWPQERADELLQLLGVLWLGSGDDTTGQVGVLETAPRWGWLPEAVEAWVAAHQADWPSPPNQTDAPSLSAWLWLRVLDYAVRQPDRAVTRAALTAEWQLAWRLVVADGAVTGVAPLSRLDAEAAAVPVALLSRWLAVDTPPLSVASRLALHERLSDPSAAGHLYTLEPLMFERLLQRLWPRAAPALSAMLNALTTATAALVPELHAEARAALLRQHAVHHLFIEALDADPAALARRYALWLRRREVAARGATAVSLQRWLHRLGVALATGPRAANRADPAVQSALQRPVNANEQWQAAQPLNGAEIDAGGAKAPAPVTTAEPRVGEPIAIANAGLVLLVAYAQRLFERLELIRNGEFVDPAASHTAVHCLAYLSDGHCDGDESGWMLNKLLTGLAIAEPIPRCPSFDDTRRAVLDGLLQAVIANWGALGQTSVEGLRASFLRREGRLVLQESEHGRAWQLQVDRRGYDVLLDRLPWGYGTIRLPWMAEAIHVKWR